MPTTPDDVRNLATEAGAEFVDLRFIDLPGTWQHFTIPVNELVDNLFSDGIGFDGSSIRGFQAIQDSDMILKADATTAIIDPFYTHPTVSMMCSVYDPLTGEPYSRDARYIAQKAEAFLTSTGIADTSYFGPEAEFFIFDDVRYDQTTNSAFYSVDSVEGAWNTGRDEGPNLGYKVRYKEGYFPVPPSDSAQNIRSEIVKTLMDAGIEVEAHHHEVGTAAQAEVDLRFATLTRMADSLTFYKYVTKNVARNYGKVATFMPKPIFGDNGNGMHVHQSLWKDGQPLFFDAGGYAGLSEIARYYIGGLLTHAAALLAICAPTTNSYRRLVPGFEAPVNLVYSQRNRSAAIRIPMYSQNPKAKRIEFRCPDPSANPYLAFPALLMAGLDGIENKIEPPAPVDRDLYELDEQERCEIKNVPGSLSEALDALEADHDFLLKGGVFTEDVLENYIAMKRDRDVAPVQLRPTPYEFMLYFDS